MAKQEIVSENLPRPVGRFSQGTIIEASGRIIFISGMTARDKSGAVIGVGDVAEQTEQVCKNIKSAIEAAGGTLDDICRLDVYLRNMEHFSKVHEVRGKYFNPPLPSSTMLEVSKFVHPDMLIEITAIGVIPTR